MFSFKKSFLIFLGVYFVLNLAYFQFFPKGTWIDDGLRKSETAITIGVLNTFFDSATSESKTKENGEKYEHIFLNKQGLMCVVNECNAFKIHLIFSVFILFVSGRYNKWLTLTIGNLIIYMLNIVRLIGLVLVLHYTPSSFEFHHEYTFSLLMYLIVFVMWYFYINEKSTNIEENM